MFTTRRTLLALAAALACLAVPAQAADTFTATLDGTQNLPEPIKTPATGKAEFRLSADGKQIAYTLTVDKLANASEVDLHLGSAATNGPLVVKLWPKGSTAPRKGDTSGVLAQGTFTAADLIGPMQGSPLADLVDEFRAGDAYVNVHTNDGKEPSTPQPGNYRIGEIRGQIK